MAPSPTSAELCEWRTSACSRYVSMYVVPTYAGCASGAHLRPGAICADHEPCRDGRPAGESQLVPPAPRATTPLTLLPHWTHPAEAGRAECAVAEAPIACPRLCAPGRQREPALHNSTSTAAISCDSCTASPSSKIRELRRLKGVDVGRNSSCRGRCCAVGLRCGASNDVDATPRRCRSSR